jgi:hypothetical protein
MQTGFYDRSIFIMLAIVEFNLFRPSLGYPISDKEMGNLFETYWSDRKYPKLGESATSNWKNGFSENEKNENQSNIDVPFHSVEPFLFKFADSSNFERLAFAYLELIGFPSVFIDEITLGDFQIHQETFAYIEDIEEIPGLAGISSVGSIENFFTFGKSLENFQKIDHELISNTLASFSSLQYSSLKVARLIWSFYIDKELGLRIAKEIIGSDSENLLLYYWFARLRSCVGDFIGVSFLFLF